MMESSDDDVVGHRVLRRVRWSRVVPVVVRAWKRSVELGCLSRKEDDGLVAVGGEELKCELVELWRDGGEDRLELREPAAERLALAVPVMFWMKFGCGRLVGDVGVDLVDEREGGRRVRRVGRRVTSYHIGVCVRLGRV